MRITASILLSWLVLSTSMSFGVSLHYCQGKVRSFSFFHEATSCGLGAMAMCPMRQKIQDKSRCCDTKDKVVKGQQHNVVFAAKVFKSVLAFVAIITLPEPSPSLLSRDHVISKFQNFKPPLIGKQVRVLVQSFLC